MRLQLRTTATLYHMGKTYGERDSGQTFTRKYITLLLFPQLDMLRTVQRSMLGGLPLKCSDMFGTKNISTFDDIRSKNFTGIY